MTPVPLTPLDCLPARGRPEFRPLLPEGKPPFLVTSPVPPSAELLREAVKEAEGNKLFLVASDEDLERDGDDVERHPRLPDRPRIGATGAVPAAAGVADRRRGRLRGDRAGQRLRHRTRQDGRRDRRKGIWMIAIACAITRDDVYESCALPGIELAREPDTELIALGFLRVRLPQLQPAARGGPEDGAGAGRFRGRRDHPPGRRDRRPGIPAEGPRGVERSRGRPRRLCRSRRRAQHRLVGGVGHLGLVHPPVRGVRRRRDPGPDLVPGEGARSTPRPARSTRSTGS